MEKQDPASGANHDPYRRAETIFALVLALSLLVLLTSMALPIRVNTAEAGADGDSHILVIASAVSAIVSAAGLVVSAILGFRKDRREREAAMLEHHRQQLEIEKLQRELFSFAEAEGNASRGDRG